MVTRRTDARRRRVLSEEFVPTDEAAVTGNNKPMVAYTFGANRRNQPKTTDLIPKRTLAVSLFFVLLAGIVAAVNTLAWYGEPLAEIVGEEGVRSLALFGPGTLANWFSSICLLLCAGICLQLFQMRKHKRDDYGGMYRVWILMSGMFLLASIDCAIDLRSITAKLFEFMTLRSLLQTPWLLMTIELIVLGIIVIRMLFEVRASKFSLAAVLLVWLGFVGCIVLRNTELPSDIAWLDQKTAYGNCILLGCVGSLAALTIYARFVFLHAHGLIKLKQKVKKVKPKAKARKKQADAVTTQPATTKKTKKKKTAQPVPEPTVTTAAPKAAPQTTSKKAATAKKTVAPKTAAPKTAAPKNAATPKAKPASPLAQKQQQTKATKAAQQAEAESAAEPIVSTKEQKIAAARERVAQKKAAAQQKAAAEAEAALEDVETIPMSKAERRRQRKLANRAARAKKAA